ncbi:hypothetical protein INS49_008805 [Diaporthe citri]|uniref:uncharacterized protein n=1 Tax=Diaporthe citri TaxID=83186 RepID=UPI001C81839B|nr:uncharacterized protein INS49_008805 [Diaporthe citri]KAG6363704.1 hypothetical protein INS49_008805 [Diaporthe citri]
MDMGHEDETRERERTTATAERARGASLSPLGPFLAVNGGPVADANKHQTGAPPDEAQQKRLRLRLRLR